MEKRVGAGLLLSFYGAMLTDRQRDVLRLYYEDDLSLSEIASLYGVTRQAAHDLIRRGEQQLAALEEKLLLRQRWVRICAGLHETKAALAADDKDTALKTIDALLLEEEELDGI